MKKGFTLIELLAVIVILAIIALIATPIILGIIEDARKGSIEASANGYIDAVEYNSATLVLEGEELKDGAYDISSIEVKLDGEKPSSGIVTIEKGKVINATLNINDQIVYYNGQVSKVIDEKTDNYKEKLLNGADPVLKDELIPVVILNDGTVIKANIKTNWYSYEDKRWANAVILFEEDKYKVGEVISEEAIKEYYVWIPRYSYRLWNVNGNDASKAEKPIEIIFGDKASTTGENNGDMYLHPAFTNFGTQGIWVGKFEPSYNEETFTDSSKFLSVNPNYESATNSDEIIIKPNVRSLNNKDVSEYFTLSYNLHQNLNSHMMTNMEWGAAAYLTYSIYGRCDSNSCTKVTINNVNNGYLGSTVKFVGQWEWGTTITGCAANKIDDAYMSNVEKCVNNYNSSNGYLASTTGNITGIYDMSGGNIEYVMGALVQSDGTIFSGMKSSDNSGFKGLYGLTGEMKTEGLDMPTLKYYNTYKNNYNFYTDEWNDYSEGILGDATKELVIQKVDKSNDKGNWFKAQATFVTTNYPWVVRGGRWNFGSSADVLMFGRQSGSRSNHSVVRIVLAFK